MEHHTPQMEYDADVSDAFVRENPQIDSAPQEKSVEDRRQGPGTMEWNAKGPNAVVEARTPRWLKPFWRDRDDRPAALEPSAPTDHQRYRG